MNVQNLIDAYGNQINAAKAIGFAKQTVTGWKNAGIPYAIQCQLWFEFKELRQYTPSREDGRESDRKAA